MSQISSFLSKQLQLNEQIYFVPNISKKPIWLFISTLLTISIISIGLFGDIGKAIAICANAVAIIPLIILCLQTSSLGLVVTNQRIMCSYGILSRNFMEIPLDQCEGVTVTQSLFGRVLNYGNIIASSVGTSHIWMVTLEEPYSLRDNILKAKKSL